MKTIRSLRPENWAWLHAKAGLMLWSVLFLIFTPNTLMFNLGYLIPVFISAVTILGLALSVYGFFVSRSDVIIRKVRGFTIEISGLYVAMAGPGAYFATQLLLIPGEGGDQRIALGAFAYFATSALVVRIVEVHQRRKKYIR
jgi:hypothetical protein